jgi:hypothetical protein
MSGGASGNSAGVLSRLVRPLASLRLTVVLFALAMVLILAGTLAQVNEGVWSVVDRYFRSAAVRIEFQLFVPTKVARIPGAIVFPGGLTIGVALLVNLLAAHAVRFKLSVKRLGIIVTHLGVILLIVGEFVTGYAAEEGNMSIDEGGSASYVEDIRESELAVIDGSSPADDLVVVVPASRLTSGASVSSGLLPFEIRVRQWLPNSRILGPMQASAEQRRMADKGLGAEVAAALSPRATGVDGQTVDVPSAYVSLHRGEETLGSYLVSVHFEGTQQVEVSGKVYGVALRFKRTYKPYTVHLIDFRHDKFVGSDRPRNFSSQVRLVDPERRVDREALIAMNEPLRHAGDTLYQSAFKPGDKGTILQVVRNPGWLIPYLSCIMVTGGMLLHFAMRSFSGGKGAR